MNQIQVQADIGTKCDQKQVAAYLLIYLKPVFAANLIYLRRTNVPEHGPPDYATSIKKHHY